MPSSRARWRSERSAEAPCAASTCGPDPVLAAERADRAQVVVEAGAGGACQGHQGERAAAGGGTALERILEPVGPDSLELVDLELEHGVLPQPEDRRGPPDRVVRGRRREQGEVGRDLERQASGATRARAASSAVRFASEPPLVRTPAAS